MLNDSNISTCPALLDLDKAIGKSKNLRKISPIKVITVGGYVAVTYFHNRETTEDIDYILDPEIKDQKKTEAKLQAAVETVALARDYSVEWFNNRVAQFATGPIRAPLFQESIAQDVVL